MKKTFLWLGLGPGVWVACTIVIGDPKDDIIVVLIQETYIIVRFSIGFAVGKRIYELTVERFKRRACLSLQYVQVKSCSKMSLSLRPNILHIQP